MSDTVLLYAYGLVIGLVLSSVLVAGWFGW